MKSWRSSVLEDGAANQVRFAAQAPSVHPGLLYLVTEHDVQALRRALAMGTLPADFEAKLTRLARGNLGDHYVEQNSRLFIALLRASLGAFAGATLSDRERLLRVLAYVRKDDDAIPDYLPGGFIDDQREVRSAVKECEPLLQAFKAWRLRHEVPVLWRA